MDRLLHYEIAKQLGEGKNGSTFLAMDAGLQRAVVLKLLERPAPPGDWSTRFLANMTRIDRLNEIGLAQFYSLEEDGGRRFLVREYIDGRSLAELVRTDPPNQAQILDIALGVTTLLRTLHSHDLVHGNLTPANVLATSYRIIKLADSGLSLTPEAWSETGEASTGEMVYLAPELLAGEEPSEQSDHYALGAILYLLWVGQPLFSNDTPEALAETIRTEPVSFEVRPSRPVPGMARLLLGKLLAKDPGDRFVSTDELLFTLKEMASLGPETPPPQIKKKWTPSSRQYLMLSILALLLIILWLVLTTDFK